MTTPPDDLSRDLTRGLELPGGRARLELLTESHTPGLLEALDDPMLWQYMPIPQPVTSQAMAGVVAAAIKGAASGAEIPFTIIDRRTGRICGSTRYLDIQPANRSLEIGWTWLSKASHRTGINTECKYLLLRHAFEAMNCVRVQLKCDGRNTQSQQAILRLGAVHEGTLRRHRVMWDGYIRDSVYYSVLAPEWPAVKARLKAMLDRAYGP